MLQTIVSYHYVYSIHDIPLYHVEYVITRLLPRRTYPIIPSSQHPLRKVGARPCPGASGEHSGRQLRGGFSQWIYCITWGFLKFLLGIVGGCHLKQAKRWVDWIMNNQTWSLSFIFVYYLFIYTQRYGTWTWNVYLNYTQFIDQTTALHVDLRYMCLQLLYVVGLSIVLIIDTRVRVCTSKFESATSVAHYLTGYVSVSVHIMNSVHVVSPAKI